MLRRSLVLALCLASLAVPSLAQANPEPIPGQYIVVLDPSVDLASVVANHEIAAGADVLQVYGHALNGYTAELSRTGLATVKADPRVDYVVQDMKGVATLGKPGSSTPPPPPWDTPQTVPTGIDRLDAEASSQRSGDRTGSLAGPPVAVVDTGVESTHPDLNVVGGTNCLGGVYTYNDGTYNDGHGHGTHVAGIVGARDNEYGVVGVAPGVPIYSVRTLDSRATGTTSSQVCGVDWVTANAAALGIKVANFSQASLLVRQDDGNCGNTNDDPLHRAMCASAAAGVLWVVGAGNSPVDISVNSNQAPMGYDEVLTVTGVADANGTPGGGGSITCRSGEVDDRYASFSAWVSSAADQAHTLAMPGVCINSTWKGATYAVQSGTSMSTPYAAGTAALCFASGACAGTPAETIVKLTGDAAAQNQAAPGFGFTGDPLHSPVSGRYYGYLLRTGAF